MIDTLVEARKALDILWTSVLLRGRCWGLRKDNNIFAGSNITMAIGEELVSISQLPNGTLRIHEFARKERTSLGGKVREILSEKGLSVETGG
jgi:hypothetical protein